jgi:hypothetical protein
MTSSLFWRYCAVFDARKFIGVAVPLAAIFVFHMESELAKFLADHTVERFAASDLDAVNPVANL